MNKKEFIKLYEDLTWSKVNDLYMYSCLVTSGFDKDTAYDLISLLDDLWIKDESNTSISTISDALYENYDYLDIDNMSTREILCEIL
jgi:hypothetical protein